MKWTIGYITDGTQDHLLNIALNNARREVPDAEIIVVGGTQKYVCNKHIPFNESIKNGWITAKKNLIAQHASNECLVIAHDYISLEPDWLCGVQEFGYNWLTCMHRVLNFGGERYRDWCVIYNDAWMNPPIDDQLPPESVPGRMMDYETRGNGRWQYYSGSYFCTKRSTLLEVPFDENLSMGQGEDVVWSRRLYEKYGKRAFTMNTFSSVRLLKPKQPVPWQGLPCI